MGREKGKKGERRTSGDSQDARGEYRHIASSQGFLLVNDDVHKPAFSQASRLAGRLGGWRGSGRVEATRPSSVAL